MSKYKRAISTASRHVNASATNAISPADDLKRIRGIGPQIEGLLHRIGIHTFAQLAALSPNMILALLPNVKGLSTERIEKQEWIGQAQNLALLVTPVQPQFDDASQIGRQRYATFTTELLIDEANDIRRTRASHVQSADEASWAGWDQARLVEFFIQHADLSDPAAEQIRQSAAVRIVDSLPSSAGTITGITRLREMVAMPLDTDTPRAIIGLDQAFSIRLGLDLTEVVIPSKALLDYKIIVRAKNLEGGMRRIVGMSRGLVVPADTLTLNIEGAPLSPGTYRLEALVALNIPSSDPSSGTGITALLEGRLLQVC